MGYRAQHYGMPYCPGQVNILKMAGGQVKFRLCPPYMAGMIFLCNFIEFFTQSKSYIFLYSTNITVVGKRLNGICTVYVEKTFSCTF